MQSDPTRWIFSGALGRQPVFLKLASRYMAFITRRSEDALKRAQDRLFDRISAPDGGQEVEELYQGLQFLRGAHAELRARFSTALGRPLHRYCELSLDNLVENMDFTQAAEVDELRLVDDDDLAESLAWEHLVDRADARFKIGLHALNLRLGELAGVGPLTAECNPVSPAVVAAALKSVIGTLECEVGARLEIIAMFDGILVGHLGEVYDGLNQILSEAGILPHIEWKIPREESEAEASGGEREAPASPEQKDRQFLDGWLFGTIQWLLAERRRLSGDLRDENSPGIDTGTLTRALAAFQQELANRERPALNQSVDELKQELLDRVRSDGTSTENQIGVLDENVLDSVGLMFDFVSGDNQLPEPFQLALGKLQIPYLKAALRNPELISADDAPAKRLLNRMAEIGLGWSRHSDPGLAQLRKVKQTVERVIHEYRDNDELFAELADDFDGFLARQRRRAEIFEKRHAEALAGRERLNQARSSVRNQIMQAIGQRQLPDLVADIIRKPWSQLMVLTLLQEGPESARWKQMVNVTRELIWSVSFQPEPENVQRLRTRLPVLAQSLKKGLRKVGYHDDEIRKVLERLKSIYTNLVRQTGSDRIVVEQNADGGVTIRGEDIDEFAQDSEVPRLDDEESLSEALNLVQGWQEGRWVQFQQSDVDEPVRAKLSWISPITGTYLFVDQRGMKAGEKSRAELARELLAEKIKPLDGDDLFTRALNRIADDLQNDVGESGGPRPDSSRVA